MGRKASKPIDAAGASANINRGVMEKSALGIVEMGLDGRVRWANRKALDMIGVGDDYAGLRLEQVFPNPQTAATIRRELKERQLGNPGRYRLCGARRTDGRFANIDVTGVPLFGCDGSVTGALGVLKNVDLESLSAKLHEIDTTLSGQPAKLLDGVARELRKYLPFDLMSVTRYSANMRHMKSFATFGETIQYANQRRWWPMSDARRKWATQKSASRIDDLSAFMRRPEWRAMLKEPATQEMLKMGFHSAVRRVIRQQGRVVGSIGLISRKAGVYSDDDVALLDTLPLEPIVAAVIDAADKSRGELKMKLLMDLNGMRDIQSACATLSARLVELFEWSHVSIFQVQHSRRRLKLIAQSCAKDVKIKYDDGFQRPIGKDTLGQVAASGEARTVAKVNPESARLRGIQGGEIRSELAIPIAFHGNATGRDDSAVRFIVNVQDERKDAFSTDEQAEIEQLVREIAVLLERISQHDFLAQCFEHSNDPVFIVNSQRRLVTCNPAAARLIGYERVEDVRIKDVADVFVDAEGARELLEGPSDELGQLLLRRIGDPPDPDTGQVATVSLHVSRSRLPELIGGALLVLRDLGDIHKRIKLDMLAKAAYQVAIETAAPLSSAIAQVDTMLKEADESERTELSRVRRYLLRVRDAYSRLATFHVATSPPLRLSRLNLAAELDSFLEDLPKAEADKIKFVHDEKLPAIRGDHFPLRIVLDTLMTPLIRCAPEERPVDVRLVQDADKVTLNISGTLPPAGTDMALDRITSQSNLSLGVATQYMNDVMNKHASRFELKLGDNGDCEYVLDFPVEA